MKLSKGLLASVLALGLGDLLTGAAIDIPLLFDIEGQNSLNLGQLSAFPGSFNPNVHGEYSFALVVSRGGTELGRSAINVNVNATGTAPANAVPDSGTSLALLGLSVLGLAGFKRKFGRA